jgi:hypothetical protein
MARTLHAANQETARQRRSFQVAPPRTEGFLGLRLAPRAYPVVTTAPTDFVIQLNLPVDPVTVQASDLRVNGIAADSFTLGVAAPTITFHYNSSPVTVQGLQSMSVAAGAMTSQSGSPLVAFSSSFRYDIVPMA